MPPSSKIVMGETSAYVNTQLFLRWLKNHFVPRKESGPVVLILDGHSSHCSDVSVLDYAAQNDIILLCLPSHTIQYLQPLDRSFFKPLKSSWQRAVTNWVHSNPGKRLSRYDFGSLLNKSKLAQVLQVLKPVEFFLSTHRPYLSMLIKYFSY